MSGQIYDQLVYSYLRFVAIRCVHLDSIQYIYAERSVRACVMYRIWSAEKCVKFKYCNILETDFF